MSPSLAVSSDQGGGTLTLLLGVKCGTEGRELWWESGSQGQPSPDSQLWVTPPSSPRRQQPAQPAQTPCSGGCGRGPTPHG